LVTVDICDTWEDDNVSDNVKVAVNIYQDNDWQGGEDVEADDPSKTKVTNVESTTATHTSIDNMFVGTIIQMIGHAAGQVPAYVPPPSGPDQGKSSNQTGNSSN
jgi:hypothetical protein